MRTLKFLSPERQQRIAKETLEIYAPIAHRLGMGKIRGELEDLGFRFLDPVGYEQVEKAVNARRKQGEAFLEKTHKLISDKLKEAGIQARVESRIKRLFSIHKKLQKQRISVDQVYDLCAMRVITRSLQDCYAVLGIIHNLWRPVPGRIKDFIAMPRPNFYQSLHTSVITEDGTPFEIQIRTEEMHKMAEEGMGYADALALAQHEGHAETDPTLDVEGYDAAVKLLILAHTALDFHARLEDVERIGITGVSMDELARTKQAGRVLKLLCVAERQGEGYRLSVKPTALPREHPMARLNAHQMGVVYHTDTNGTIVATIEEENPLPTASAVVRDLINMYWQA